MAKDQLLPAGTTSYVVEVQLRSTTSGQGIGGLAAGSVTCNYLRRGAAAWVSVTLQAMTQGTWVDSGWVYTGKGGIYQVGLPNAAIASGADGVIFLFQAASALDAKIELLLDSRVGTVNTKLGSFTYNDLATLLTDIWRFHGLRIGDTLTVNATSKTVGGIVQSIAADASHAVITRTS